MSGVNPYDLDSDPYDYWKNPEDAKRRDVLLSYLKNLDPVETADVGCGEGFLTEHLPGKHVSAFDSSDKALESFRTRLQTRGFEFSSRFDLRRWDVLDKPPEDSKFDLIVVTGLLYHHLLGDAGHLATSNIGTMLKQGGTLISVHIEDWAPFEMPLDLTDLWLYSYRSKIHRVEVFKKL